MYLERNTRKMENSKMGKSLCQVVGQLIGNKIRNFYNFIALASQIIEFSRLIFFRILQLYSRNIEIQPIGK